MAGAWLAVVHPEVLDDLQHWLRHEQRTARRLLELMRAIRKAPFSGIGKPEPLKYPGADAWSRRVEFLQGRYHY